MASLKERLTEILLTNQVISQEQLDYALKVQRERGGRLPQILTDLGYVDEMTLVNAIAQGLGISAINLAKYKINPEIVQLVPKDLARRFQAVPLSRLENELMVAMADPTDLTAIDLLSAASKCAIVPMIATARDIQQALTQCYSDNVHQEMEGLLENLRKDKIELVEETAESRVDTTELLQRVQEAPVVKVTDAIVTMGIKLRASDIFIEPMEKRLRIRLRVDGVLQEMESPPLAMHAAIVSRIKVMCDLDIAERRIPQDGRFRMIVDERPIDFRVNVLPSSYGEKVAMRILDKGTVKLDLEKLGFAEADLPRLKRCVMRPHGLILTCGPTGSGKTTTLYSVLKYVESPEKNLVTVEDPVEYELHGINQVQALPDIGLTFAAALRSILRQDPDIILVGEIRDGETADMAIKSALTGHLVLSTLHTNTASGTVVRLANMGVEPFLINSCLIASVGQRLVRKICAACKESYPVSEAVARQFKLPYDAKQPPVFYRGKGCRQCANTGYSGREIVAEVLVMNNDVRGLIAKHAREPEIEQAARRAGMKTMRENALQKVLAGSTTLEELLRTTMGDQAN